MVQKKIDLWIDIEGEDKELVYWWELFYLPRVSELSYNFYDKNERHDTGSHKNLASRIIQRIRRINKKKWNAANLKPNSTCTCKSKSLNLRVDWVWTNKFWSLVIQDDDLQGKFDLHCR